MDIANKLIDDKQIRKKKQRTTFWFKGDFNSKIIPKKST